MVSNLYRHARPWLLTRDAKRTVVVLYLGGLSMAFMPGPAFLCASVCMLTLAQLVLALRVIARTERGRRQ